MEGAKAIFSHLVSIEFSLHPPPLLSHTWYPVGIPLFLEITRAHVKLVCDTNQQQVLDSKDSPYK